MSGRPGADDFEMGPPVGTTEIWERKFRDDLAVDVAFEASLLPKELWTVVVIGMLIVLREVWL